MLLRRRRSRIQKLGTAHVVLEFLADLDGLKLDDQDRDVFVDRPLSLLHHVLRAIRGFGEQENHRLTCRQAFNDRLAIVGLARANISRSHPASNSISFQLG